MIGLTERERLLALDTYEILDSPPELEYDLIVKRASQLFRTMGSAITIVARSRQWFKAEIGLGISGSSRAESFCSFLLDRGDIMVVNDAWKDDRFCTNSLVVGPPFVRFYAGAPIKTGAGVIVGALCIIDKEPRPKGLSRAEAALLRAMADGVALSFNMRRLTRVIQKISEVVAESREQDLISYQRHWWHRQYAPKDVSTAVPTLTSRQTEILTLASIGKSAPEIGIVTGLTPRTVRFHIAAACKRLGVLRSNHAMSVAILHGLIDVPPA